MGQFEAKDLRAIFLSAALAVGFYLSGWVVPLLGSLVSLCCPVPLILLYYRRGLGAGRVGTLSACLIALVAFLVIDGSLAGGLYFMYYAAIASVLCEAPVFGLAFDRSVAAASLAGLVVVLGFFAYAGALSPGGYAAFKDLQMAHINTLLEVSGQGVADQESFEAVRLYFLQISQLVLNLFPGLLTVGTLLVAWVNALIAHRLLTRKAKTEKGYSSSLADWRSPDKLVWILIAAGALMVFGQGWVFWLGANLLLVSGFIYFLQGVGILAHLFEKKNTPRLFRVMSYTVIGVAVASMSYLALVVPAIGLFDLWFDFRKLKAPPTQ